MTKLEKYIETFLPILSLIDGLNVVIGGIEALRIHGLTVRESNDLDVIIYQPNLRQKQVINNLSIFEQDKPKNNNQGTYQRSFKFKKNDLFIDILFEEDKPMPEDLLLYRYKLVHPIKIFSIQSIQNVIDAKRNYHNDFHTSEGIKQYSRIKDMKDFQDLKNHNFNL